MPVPRSRMAGASSRRTSRTMDRYRRIDPHRPRPARRGDLILVFHAANRQDRRCGPTTTRRHRSTTSSTPSLRAGSMPSRRGSSTCSPTWRRPSASGRRSCACASRTARRHAGDGAAADCRFPRARDHSRGGGSCREQGSLDDMREAEETVGRTEIDAVRDQGRRDRDACRAHGRSGWLAQPTDRRPEPKVRRVRRRDGAGRLPGGVNSGNGRISGSPDNGTSLVRRGSDGAASREQCPRRPRCGGRCWAFSY